jgi:hypothetical protein
MRSSRFSFRSRVSSSRSSFISPLLPFVRSARACWTQRPSAEAVRSSSRATAPTVLPSSRTKRTAPSLNSSENCRRVRRPRASLDMRDIVSTSYEADRRQTPEISCAIKHTSIEAAEQALPNSRARAGGRGLLQTPPTDFRPLFELVASWSQESMTPTHLLSVPVRCTGHQRLIREAWKRVSTLSGGSLSEPGGYAGPGQLMTP